MDSKKSKKNKKVRKFIASSSIQKSTKSWRFSIISARISDLSKLSKSFEAQFHVLAVDDSLIDRKLIERLLKTSSYQVTAVDSGIKALKYLGLLDDEEDTDPFSTSANKNNHEVEVNLIITDYCMPEMTGYDLLRKIKGSRWLRDIPVVIMSSENVPSRINSCLEEGAEEFFLKPVQQSDVNKLKPRLLRGKHHDLLENSNIEGINKRKTMEECVSQDRTRPRYNALEL